MHLLVFGFAMLVVASAFAQEDQPGPGRYFVATDGNDAWSGKLPAPNAAKTDGPFATLGRARDAIRAMKASTGLTMPVTVMVREGTYYLSEPLRFAPEDSGTEQCPITYMAYPGEKPVLSAGRRITGWTTKDGRLYTAFLPEVKEGAWFFRQLRVGEERQIRARTPNFDPQNPYTGGYLLVTRLRGGEFGYGMGAVQDPGTWLEYAVDVPAEGDYTLRILYANNGETNKRFFGHTDMSHRTTLSVDGGAPVSLADMDDTGSFYSGFRWARAATVHLTAGRHVLRWENVKGGGLSLDAFALCDDPSYEPQIVDGVELSKPSPGKHLVWFHAEAYTGRHGENPTPMPLARQEPTGRTTLRFTPGALKPISASQGAEVFVIPEWDWVSELVKLDSLDPERGIAKVSGANCMKPLWAGNRFFVENAMEALDQPGEWCLNRQSGVLTYWPKRADFEQVGVIAPVHDRAIEFCGDPERQQFVSHIRIEGFTITDTGFTAPETIRDVYFPNDAAVWLRAATHCRIAGNTFRDVGGYGVTLCGPSAENEVVGNHIVGAGQGGVYLNGIAEEIRKPAARGLRPNRNLVAGNYIHHCGAFYKHVAGIYLAFAHDNVLSHNLIHDTPRYGISLKMDCPGNRVEFNEVRRTNLETQDTGAIEMSENLAGSIVQNNLVADSIGCGYDQKQGKLVMPFGAGGIYLDNFSSKCVVRNNIVLRTTGGLWLNWGSENLIENNIFVDGREHQIILNMAPSPHEATAGNRFERNILSWSDPKALLYSVSHWKQGQPSLASDYNLFFAGASSPTIQSVAGPAVDSLAKWRELGQDAHSLIADPRFVAPEKDDYRLKPDSPAFKLGFRPIPVERIGLKGFERSWKSRPHVSHSLMPICRDGSDNPLYADPNLAMSHYKCILDMD